MPDIQITIKNLPEIRAAFAKSPTLMRRNLNTAISKSIFTIGAKSRKNTPVDTGRLRASTKETLGDLKGEVGTHTNYDIFVHEGTRFMRSRPYLRGAVAEAESTVQDYMTHAVQQTLDEVARQT